ncbi:MAG: hypothetical protein AAF316_05935, partial [Cyanobacteria bacterium P01_A01_bin.80]
SISKPPKKKKSGKKRGGQPVRKGHSRHLYDVSECEAVLDQFAIRNLQILAEREASYAIKKFRYSNTFVNSICSCILEN